MLNMDKRFGGGESKSDKNNDSSVPMYDIVDVMARPTPTHMGSDLTPTVSKRKDHVSFFALYRYATPLDVLLISLGVVSGIGSGILMPVLIYYMCDIYESFSYDSVFAVWFSVSGSSSSSGNGFMANLNDSVYKLLIFGAVNCVLQFVIITAGNLSAQRQCNSMRRKFFENAMGQEICWFDATQTGTLVAGIASIQQIQSGLGTPVPMLASNITMLLTVLVLGLVKGWRMALVLACSAPIVTIIVGHSGGVVGRAIAKAESLQMEAGKIAEEFISSVRTVTAFSIQGQALERYNETNKEIKTAGYTRGKATGVLLGATNLVLYWFIGLAFWYGSTLVTDGKMTSVNVFIVVMSITTVTMALPSISPSLGSIFEAMGAAYEVFKIIDRNSAIDPRSESGLKIDIKGNIEFKDITFRYPTRPEAIVLKNFNLKIKKGRTVALVGSSGSGKSTIVGLLERFYDTEEGFGTVYVDGHDIKDLNLKHFRSQVGIVTQEPVLFATTIAHNIAYGYNGGATQEMIQAAAKEANAHDFIMKLPEGYNTLVGERGTQLSGGQKQRISIARALIRKPKILIFDEATSALDAESERVVQESIDKVAAGRTCIIIAHRLSTVRNADCIVVIHKGVVVEKGNHKELMRLGGTYKNLVERQQIQGHDSSSSKTKAAKKKRKEDEKEKVKEYKTKTEEETLYQKEQEKKNDENHSYGTVKRAFGLLGGDAVFMFFNTVFSLLNGALVPIEGVILSEIMTLIIYDPKYADIIGMTQEEHDNRVIYWAIGYVAFGVASFLAVFFQSFFSYATAERLTHYIRYESFKAIMRQETGWFDDKSNMVGTLTTRLASDSMNIHSLTCTHVGTLIQVVASLIVSIVIGAIGNWKVALVTLAVTPVKVAANVFHMRCMLNFGQKTREAHEQCGRVASETLQSIRTVASLGREKTFLGNYVKELAKPNKVFLKSVLINATGMAFNGLTQFWVVALVFWYGGTLIRKGETDFNGVIKAYNVIGMGTRYFGDLISYFPNYGKAIAAAQNIFQLLDRKSAIPTPTTVLPKTMKEDKNILSASKNAPIPHPKPTREDGKMYAKVTGKIEFRNVRFAYPIRPGQEILKGLNLVAKPKQTVALVGESGCGKSTTISLIERFYSPTSGQILLDGHPIDKLEIEWLRSQIGLVSQEPTLFATSIRENIRYGKPDATDEEVIEAAKKSNAHTFITGFPDGYDTMVGEKGVTLSGGQKQRIAIARALIRNPKILLLDEATSALDAESEHVVQEALDKAREGRTTITIAHRLSTIKDADAILVFEKGVIVEKGKHEELLELNGVYSDLIKAQTQI